MVWQKVQLNWEKVHGMKHFLAGATRTVHDEYFVLVSACPSSGNTTAVVRAGRSNESAWNALQRATLRLPILMNHKQYSWLKVDYVTAVKRLHQFNYIDNPIQEEEEGDGEEEEEPWVGIALDWDVPKTVFLPDVVRANTMIDVNGFLRWERIIPYLQRTGVPLASALPNPTDDTSLLEVLDLFRSDSVFVDLTEARPFVRPLHHGHVEQRTDEKMTAHMLRTAAIAAGQYLARNLDDTGAMTTYYQPRSNLHDSATATSDQLGFQASGIYAMARLYRVWKDPELLAAMQRGLKAFLSRLERCPLPYEHDRAVKCVVLDEGELVSQTSKLGLNSWVMLAFAEYIDVTGGDKTFLPVVHDLAEWVTGCQQPTEDGTTFNSRRQSAEEVRNNDQTVFIQKVYFHHHHDRDSTDKEKALPSVILEEQFEEPFAVSVASFALSRVTNVVEKYQFRIPAGWRDAAIAAANSVLHEQVDETITIDNPDQLDPWLVHAIGQLQALGKTSTEMRDYSKEYNRFVMKHQAHAPDFDHKDGHEKRDRLGSLLDHGSATVTAELATGLCASIVLLDNETDARVRQDVILSLEAAMRFVLQLQYRPEKAMYLPIPAKISGGIHDSIHNLDLPSVTSQNAILGLTCLADALESMSKHQKKW